jgi:hypothetical protein
LVVVVRRGEVAVAYPDAAVERNDVGRAVAEDDPFEREDAREGLVGHPGTVRPRGRPLV